MKCDELKPLVVLVSRKQRKMQMDGKVEQALAQDCRAVQKGEVMAKAYKCSHCGEVLVLGESLFGRQFKVFCPKCKKMATFNSKEETRNV